MTDEPTRLQTSLLKVEGLLEQRGWHDHNAARLWVIVDRGGQVLARPPSPPLLHDWSRIPDPTLRLLDLAKRIGQITGTRGVVGVIWSHEAWMAEMTEADPVDYRDQLNAARHARELYKFPNRVETRQVIGMHMDGEEAWVLRRRGEGAFLDERYVEQRRMTAGVAARAAKTLEEDPEEFDVRGGGIIPNALRRMAGIPARPDPPDDY